MAAQHKYLHSETLKKASSILECYTSFTFRVQLMRTEDMFCMKNGGQELDVRAGGIRMEAPGKEEHAAFLRP
jgi:hypothetical protein